MKLLEGTCQTINGENGDDFRYAFDKPIEKLSHKIDSLTTTTTPPPQHTDTNKERKDRGKT